MFLSQTARLTFPLQQAKNVAFSHGALDVADNCARGVVKKLNTNLGDSTSVALKDFKRALELGVLLGTLLVCPTYRPAQNSLDFGELYSVGGAGCSIRHIILVLWRYCMSDL